MLSKLSVTGIGMVSPVGHSAGQTCASLRAGITRFAELDGVVDRYGEPIIVARVQGFGTADQHLERLRRIGIASCREAIASLPHGELAQRKVTLSVLCKDAKRPGIAVDRDGFLESMVAEMGLPVSTTLKVYSDGNAAGMKVLLDAQYRIAADPQAIELLWGIDSLLDLQTLAYLERAHRLKTPSQPRSAIPGESSVCLVVQADTAAMQRGVQRYCRIEGIGTAVEPAPVGSDAPCLGEGLTTAIYGAVDMAQWHKDDVTQVYADLNGEIYRTHEWMLASCRTLSGPEMTHPADCLGDIGAAFSPLLIGMAAIALDRGYARSKRILVFCSSDSGLRGCACIAGSTP